MRKSRDTLSILSWIKYIWVSRLWQFPLSFFSQRHHVLRSRLPLASTRNCKPSTKCWTNKAPFRCPAPAAARTQPMRTWTTMCRVAFTSNRLVAPHKLCNFMPYTRYQAPIELLRMGALHQDSIVSSAWLRSSLSAAAASAASVVTGAC